MPVILLKTWLGREVSSSLPLLKGFRLLVWPALLCGACVVAARIVPWVLGVTSGPSLALSPLQLSRTLLRCSELMVSGRETWVLLENPLFNFRGEMSHSKTLVFLPIGWGKIMAQQNKNRAGLTHCGPPAKSGPWPVLANKPLLAQSQCQSWMACHYVVPRWALHL